MTRKGLTKLTLGVLVGLMLPISWAIGQGVSPGNIIRAVQEGTWSMAQSGTWTVQPGNTANTTPWLVKQDASGVVTATLQNAATADGNGSTLTVTGMASALVTVNCSGCGGVTQVNFEGSQNGTNFSPIRAELLDGSLVDTSTVSAGITQWRIPVAGLQLLRTPVSDYVNGTITVTATAIPHTTTRWGDISSVAITGNVGVTQQTSPWVVAGNAADDSANSTAKVPVLAGKATASNPSWTEGRQVPLRIDPTTGAVFVVIPENGTTPKTIASAAGANQDANEVKDGAGVLYGVTCTNLNAAARYVKMYETGTPTSASTVRFKFLVPGNTAGGGHSPNLPADGVAFATDIGVRYTTGLADNDTGAVTSGEQLCTFFYR